jgi:N-acyl-D-aspartate/D-glutamate deacylase
MHLLPKLLFILGFTLAALNLNAQTAQYDLVLSGGRLVDPQNTIDQVTNIAITDGKIAAIDASPLKGKKHIDVSGLVVSPGFIDLHSHALTSQGQRYQALDGVTTALELEAGVYPVNAIEQLFPEGARLNYGASVSHLAVRQQVMGNIDQPHLLLPAKPLQKSAPTNKTAAFQHAPSNEQIAAISRGLKDGLNNGGLGIGLLLDYLSDAVTDQELTAVFNVAADYHAPVIVHIRRGLPGDSSGLRELISHAERSGAALHVCHINASAMSAVGGFLDLISQARERGIDVTTEAYPYNAGSTTIGAAVFGRDWRAIFAIDYQDVEWAATGERFTAESFAKRRKSDPDGMVIHHYGKEAWTQRALLTPGVLIASDAMPVVNQRTGVHPRGVGTFSRVLGRYTNTGDAEGSMPLATAIYKMSTGPAKRLRSIATRFNNKGHLAIGADADITVFDEQRIQDLATYQSPLTASEGVRYLLVGGELVVENGAIVEERKPGQLLTAEYEVQK